MGLENNFIPATVRKIHMIAACGTGMGALACMLKDLGYEVTGSDHNVYPPMSDFLEAKGVTLLKGFDGANLDPETDLVIVGNAVFRSNPEAVAAMERGIAFCSMPQALNYFVAKDKKIILVTGTHGKTTTSSLMAHVLNQAGLDPSFMIGGIVTDFNSNYRIGGGDYIVIEGDEYDTAFFDKGPKFMHYAPCFTIMTGVEFDHADIFRDLDHVRQIFAAFVKGLLPESMTIAWGDDMNLKEILAHANNRIQRYGHGPGEWQCIDLKVEQGTSVFRIKDPEGKILRFAIPLMGDHNVMNALAVIAVARQINIPVDVLARALVSFSGVKRRQEVRGVKRGITVMDDFAHHPTAVRETLRAVRPFYTQGRIIAVFEPRTNSSMRKVFQTIYPQAFDDADLVCICRPSAMGKIPVEERLSPEKLVADICERGTQALLFDDTDTLVDFLVKMGVTGDLMLIMSNGGFDNIHNRLLERL
ncbi:Mpl [Desulforapulum autotrophicum HRM2]|uniref:UDP-N-acetylmuramate--L-alanine ligase n=1 Tax=Desulforapulum autotrophicum (strain ATCC 43914 / DSM 3382 / VKM B-1955 / HRM2) TaxID=177437 RepID=C0QCS0_DESAH|nr:UDP-N-acetylmuramate:L-alanyl-gamma-D-glutamyl-meso-diaminopimelate ligase [Desulforapulum autotrophicum]ACN15147.1 Mpl [Desulforapulum autotrophicum HRM2]